jgi:hypothetical protein
VAGDSIRGEDKEFDVGEGEMGTAYTVKFSSLNTSMAPEEAC